MMRRCVITLTAALVAATVSIAAQVGGTVVSGNPTPGTEQPAPPNLADRITATGCLRPAPPSTTGLTPHDANTPSDARFVLANAERVDRVPPGTGGSSLTSSVSGRSYRLAGIDSQFSPFVNMQVEVSGEIAAAAGGVGSAAPAVVVEFVQKVASTCK